MRTVTYKSVLQKANALLTNKVTPSTDDNTSLNIFINARYREYFERFFWHELMRVERRQFRPAYDGTAAYSGSTATAVDEVFYWPTQAYYQALRNQLPNAVNSIVRSGTTATVDFGGSHYLNTGDRVQISAASPSLYNGTYTITVTSTTTFTYTLAADPGANASGTIRCAIHPANEAGEVIAAYWALSTARYSGDDWSATAAYTVDASSVVYQPQDGRYYQCIAAHTNNPPPNADYWAVLTDFERDIDYEGGNQGEDATAMGEVKEVWDSNPWTDERACPIDFTLTSDGLIVRGELPDVWVEFRLRPNDFTGATHSTSTSYAVGDQVYYAPTSSTGDYYISIQAAASGQVPTNTAYWRKLDFPYVLAHAVAQAAYADLLKVTGKTSKWAEEIRESLRLLQREFDKVERQQGQASALNVQQR